MPQIYSTDSFNMENRDRVDIEITILNPHVLLRSISVNRYTLHNQRVT